MAVLPARLPKVAVPRHYTWIAPTHDLLARLVEARARRRALRWADVQDGETVLDAATGTGLSLVPLLQANPSGWTEALDLTPAMLRRAQRRAERFADTRGGHLRWHVQPGDVYDLPYSAAHFDLVHCGYMLDLVPEREMAQVLASFFRVLKPGGRLVALAETTPERTREWLWQTLYRLWPPLMGGCRGVETAPHLRAAGFEDVRRARIVQWTFPSEVVFARKPA